MCWWGDEPPETMHAIKEKNLPYLVFFLLFSIFLAMDLWLVSHHLLAKCLNSTFSLDYWKIQKHFVQMAAVLKIA